MYRVISICIYILANASTARIMGFNYKAYCQMFWVCIYFHFSFKNDFEYILYFSIQRKNYNSLLSPAEVCDLLKATLLVACSALMFYIDTNMLYHLVKSQSVIKLYIFYNMLEVGDRLFSAFGQDTIDALFWTATEPRDKKREHFGVIPHLFFAVIYVCILLKHFKYLI